MLKFRFFKAIFFVAVVFMGNFSQLFSCGPLSLVDSADKLLSRVDYAEFGCYELITPSKKDLRDRLEHCMRVGLTEAYSPEYPSGYYDACEDLIEIVPQTEFVSVLFALESTKFFICESRAPVVPAVPVDFKRGSLLHTFAKAIVEVSGKVSLYGYNRVPAVCQYIEKSIECALAQGMPPGLIENLFAITDMEGKTVLHILLASENDVPARYLLEVIVKFLGRFGHEKVIKLFSIKDNAGRVAADYAPMRGVDDITWLYETLERNGGARDLPSFARLVYESLFAGVAPKGCGIVVAYAFKRLFKNDYDIALDSFEKGVEPMSFSTLCCNITRMGGRALLAYADTYGNSFLHSAAHCNQVDRIRELTRIFSEDFMVAHLFDYFNFKNKAGKTALMIACEHNNYQAIKAILIVLLLLLSDNCRKLALCQKSLIEAEDFASRAAIQRSLDTLFSDNCSKLTLFQKALIEAKNIASCAAIQRLLDTLLCLGTGDFANSFATLDKIIPDLDLDGLV